VLTVVTEQEPTPAATTTGGSLIDEIVRDGARRMLAAGLEAEVAAYIAAHAGEVDAEGRRLVVRNGHAQPRQVLTSSGAVKVQTPRVNDKRVDEVTGERRRFASVILPAWCRKSPKINEVLPLLYLHGLSSQDFVPALESFLGTGSGLSAATVTRLTAQWQDEVKAFGDRGLSTVDYVYVWADGIHVNIRLDEEKLCLLVMVGVRVDATRSSSRWPRATGTRPGRGWTCCATAPAGACAPRSSRSVTGRWGSGRRCARCSRPPGSSAAGSIMPTSGLCRR
jgi:transposase-like protein